MDNTIRVFSGRTFSSEDIELIRWTKNKYPKLSRIELARTLCEFWEWTTPAGLPKRIQCVEFLEKLESEGVIVLPPKRHKKSAASKTEKEQCFDNNLFTEITGSVKDFDPITLEIARQGTSLKRWKAYVDQYHMLGEKAVYGSRLQYFIKSGDLEVGCMQFSASSWALEAREKWIGWTVADKKVRLNLIVNNSRYLIFPWVHIKNLASKALSLAAIQLQEDWLREYCYAPVLLETFVDLAHFKGTCYKAANWKYLGETKGRGRMDRNKEAALSKKAIFVYPLQKDFKEVLKGENPFKAVNPDE
ncbi:MAG: DUF4338 domain-containing protein [Chitinophagaceae bacterium]|nr:DUF4338 domain-containing protein [Chitinophagaceae bacterium]